MRKTIIALSLLLMVGLVFSLCACGGAGDDGSKDAVSSVDTSVESTHSEGNSAEASAPESSVDDSKVEYKVTVTDSDGKGMAGVMVQLCLDSCMPGVTDANGVATFKLAEADYKVSVMTMPEGYTYAVDTTEYHFEEGSTTLTIVLTAVE